MTAAMHLAYGRGWYSFFYNNHLGVSSIEQSSKKIDARVGNLNKQGKGATKVKLNPSQQKSINGLKEQISNHKKKLADYTKNPDSFDNKGLLKKATPALRKKIINTRIEKLKKQIQTFEKDIQAINNGTKSVLEKFPKQE